MGWAPWRTASGSRCGGGQQLAAAGKVTIRRHGSTQGRSSGVALRGPQFPSAPPEEKAGKGAAVMVSMGAAA